MKLTVIGGGSTYTPGLIDGFARLREVPPLGELWLVDPDAHRLELASSPPTQGLDVAVAVVCVTGINRVGVRADGETARFPALGEISGD